MHSSCHLPIAILLALKLNEVSKLLMLLRLRVTENEDFPHQVTVITNIQRKNFFLFNKNALHITRIKQHVLKYKFS